MNKTLIYLQVGCRSVHVLFIFLVFVCAYWCSTHTMLCVCFVFLRLVYPMLPVSLYCPFVIDPSVFSNVYLSCVLCTLCCQFLCIYEKKAKSQIVNNSANINKANNHILPQIIEPTTYCVRYQGPG
jgi:hypothetical protein